MTKKFYCGGGEGRKNASYLISKLKGMGTPKWSASRCLPNYLSKLILNQIPHHGDVTATFLKNKIKIEMLSEQMFKYCSLICFLVNRKKPKLR